MVKSPAPKSKLGVFETAIYPVEPSKLNAIPTSPVTKVTPPTSAPLLVPRMSLALPSPDHQATSPLGGGSHRAFAKRSTSIAPDINKEIFEECNYAALCSAAECR